MRKLKRVSELEPGEFVKWNHLEWYEVLEVERYSKGYTYIKMKDHPSGICNVWHDVEMPWRPA